MLSAQQLAVLACAAAGCTGRETALRLGIAPATVWVHLAQARVRLGARSTTHAVAIALTQGLISFTRE